jgi:hypothetical protein
MQTMMSGLCECDFERGDDESCEFPHSAPISGLHCQLGA